MPTKTASGSTTTGCSSTSNVPSGHVTDWLTGLEPHHGARSATPAGHYAARPQRDGQVCMRASKATRLHGSCPGGAVTGETISPTRVWTGEVWTLVAGQTALIAAGRPVRP